jgi:hypothetical protein
MVAFEDTEIWIVKKHINIVSTHLLVVSVSHPGESTEGTNHHGDVGDHSHDKDGVVGDIEFPEIVDHLEEQPYYSRQSATAVDPSKMLQ